MIKNGVINREKEILLMIDKLYDKNYGSDKLIQESKILLELGQANEKKWDTLILAKIHLLLNDI